jgi:hypothetical protein
MWTRARFVLQPPVFHPEGGLLIARESKLPTRPADLAEYYLGHGATEPTIHPEDERPR